MSDNPMHLRGFGRVWLRIVLLITRKPPNRTRELLSLHRIIMLS